mmetsp:Transcript_20454/g.50315  ORF Transcript_20454/g.50315 Transcript_20454/m.50315 type:complete len:324 (-) Transcript_20454:225-1196(-)
MMTTWIGSMMTKHHVTETPQPTSICFVWLLPNMAAYVIVPMTKMNWKKATTDHAIVRRMHTSRSEIHRSSSSFARYSSRLLFTSSDTVRSFQSGICFRSHLGGTSSFGSAVSCSSALSPCRSVATERTSDAILTGDLGTERKASTARSIVHFGPRRPRSFADACSAFTASTELRNVRCARKGFFGRTLLLGLVVLVEAEAPPSAGEAGGGDAGSEGGSVPTCAEPPRGRRRRRASDLPLPSLALSVLRFSASLLIRVTTDGTLITASSACLMLGREPVRRVRRLAHWNSHSRNHVNGYATMALKRPTMSAGMISIDCHPVAMP